MKRNSKFLFSTEKRKSPLCCGKVAEHNGVDKPRLVEPISDIPIYSTVDIELCFHCFLACHSYKELSLVWPDNGRPHLLARRMESDLMSVLQLALAVSTVCPNVK
jgi:hypothetical protein